MLKEHKHIRDTYLNGLVVVNDGVVSFSLKDMSFLISAVVTSLLMYLLYNSCQHPDKIPNHQIECKSYNFPWVSEVVGQTLMTNRLFTLSTTILMWGVNQQNIRVYFKMLYGKINDKENDALLVLGYVSCIAMPLLGLFDMNSNFNYHFWIAVTWILSLTSYMAIVGLKLGANIRKFDRQHWRAIKITQLASYGLLIGLAALGYSYVQYGL